MKKFNIPPIYQSNFIGKIKEIRRTRDKLKKDFSPTILNFGPVVIKIARHFGFCYGVENAVEIAYKTLEMHPDRRIFLLSEMIHNPDVNKDLLDKGVKFIMDTKGNNLIDWKILNSDDIVIVPAFGTTIEIQKKLESIGISPYSFDTTCPFVEKVWNRAAQIGERGYSIIIHGKPSHEETRATFSHSQSGAPSLVVNDMSEAKKLIKYIKKEADESQFREEFKNQYSSNFNPLTDLQKIGVVNQTTMLASETQAISDYLKEEILKFYNVSEDQAALHFANTRDTLCYATNDNQDSTFALIKEKADFAIIVGGYNSSNTTHLVELCEEKFKTYFIKNASCFINESDLSHFNIHTKREEITKNYLKSNQETTIALTCGASCPDSEMEKVLMKILTLFDNTESPENVLNTI